MASTFTTPEIVTPATWLEARKSLLAKEKAHTAATDALAAERRKLPATLVTKPYTFTSLSGSPLALADLFSGRRQLIVYHFMLDPTWTAGCAGCCVIGDHIGHLSHLNSRDTTFMAVSAAPIEKIAAFKQRMGWDFPWVSSAGTDFNRDFGVHLDGKEGGNMYNYKESEAKGEMPGASVFLKVGGEGEGEGEDEGKVLHTYSTYARGLQHNIGVEMFLDLTPMGRQGHMGKFKHHDKY